MGFGRENYCNAEGAFLAANADDTVRHCRPAPNLIVNQAMTIKCERFRIGVLHFLVMHTAIT
jgi:hypothetical protein